MAVTGAMPIPRVYPAIRYTGQSIVDLVREAPYLQRCSLNTPDQGKTLHLTQGEVSIACGFGDWLMALPDGTVRVEPQATFGMLYQPA
jgi:hypothetical protein